MRMTGSGLSVDLPTGWEGMIGRAGGVAPQGTDASMIRPPTVAHMANFPLPSVRADFGAEVVETMRIGDVFVVLFEYPGSASTALFAAEGVPRLTARDFDPDTLQHRMPGQSGLQRFFHVAERAFCLYVVVGSHLDRADVIAQLNGLLESLEIQ
jgi:hypothetical protein